MRTVLSSPPPMLLRPIVLPFRSWIVLNSGRAMIAVVSPGAKQATSLTGIPRSAAIATAERILINSAQAFFLKETSYLRQRQCKCRRVEIRIADPDLLRGVV